MEMYADRPGGEGSVDPVEEMRLRTWARKHYQPVTQRDSRWHPVILDEMSRRDRELVG